MTRFAKRVFFAVVWRWYKRRVQRDDTKYRPHLESFCPGILDAFAEIERASGVRGPHYVAKCWELLRLLQEHRPTFIVEMGSGRTSLVFAAYASRTGSRYISFEQDPDWEALINRIIDQMYHMQPVQHAGVETLPRGGRYTVPLPAGADFVYVDAPFIPGESFPTFTGKAVAMDVPLSLAAGHRPHVIAVDDRTATVDELLTFPGYAFAGGWLWARERGVVSHGMKPMRHSVFVHASPV